MKQTRHTFRIVLSGLGAAALLAAGIAPVHAQNAHAKISAEQAKSAALKRYPGTVEGKVLLENEEGSWQYAVNIRSGKKLREVMVSAKTGKIANVEVTTKAEESKEAAAEASHAKKPAKGTHTPPGKM